MKLLICLLTVLLILSCSSSKTDEASSSDTTKVSIDTVQNVSETPQPSGPRPADGDTNSFPTFNMEAPSGDSLEIEVNHGIAALMEIYDSIYFFTITETTNWERPFFLGAQEGEGRMDVEKRQEVRTWYYDYKNQLKAITVEGTTDSDALYSTSSLYLFSNDSLIAVSERQVNGGEVTVINQTRALSTLCPRCGIGASFQEGDNGTPVEHLSASYLESRQQEHNESIRELARLIKSKQKSAKAEGNDYHFTVKRTKEADDHYKSPAITYPVEYSVNEKVYEMMVRKE